MNAQTYTVTSGYTDREGRHWVFVRGLPGKLSCDEAFPEGSSVRVANGRAFR
ncbi:MAG: hypothetical protein ACT6TH_15365 [Brevundimonas sp.]|uniref:hypothetical protein n=1 Tax=Brevundimonas sp. TaxID=1871086 RepID=UPI004034EBE8